MDNTGTIATIDAVAVTRQIMDEREKRYTERYEACQIAIQVAFAAQEKMVAAAILGIKEAFAAELASAQRAVLKTETMLEKRFDGVNEFRSALADQTASLITRNEVTARMDSLAARIDMGLSAVGKEANATISRIDRMEGKQGPRSESDHQFINHEERITNTASRLDRIEGRTGGVGFLASSLVAGLGLCIAIASVAVQLSGP